MMQNCVELLTSFYFKLVRFRETSFFLFYTGSFSWNIFLFLIGSFWILLFVARTTSLTLHHGHQHPGLREILRKGVWCRENYVLGTTRQGISELLPGEMCRVHEILPHQSFAGRGWRTHGCTRASGPHCPAPGNFLSKSMKERRCQGPLNSLVYRRVS